MTPLRALQEANRRLSRILESYQTSQEARARVSEAPSWWQSLSPDQKRKVAELTGIPVAASAAQIGMAYVKLLAPLHGQILTALDREAGPWWNALSVGNRRELALNLLGSLDFGGMTAGDYAKDYRQILQDGTMTHEARQDWYKADVVRTLYRKAAGGSSSVGIPKAQGGPAMLTDRIKREAVPAWIGYLNRHAPFSGWRETVIPYSSATRTFGFTLNAGTMYSLEIRIREAGVGQVDVEASSGYPRSNPAPFAYRHTLKLTDLSSEAFLRDVLGRFVTALEKARKSA